MTAVDEYVRQVMEHVPYASPERGRIEIDVRAHLEETVAAEESVQQAVGRMGAPRDVALAYLSEVAQPLASLGSRAAAFVVDFLLGAALVVVCVAVIGVSMFGLARSAAPEGAAVAAWGVEAFLLVGAIAAITLLSLAYFPILEWKYGQTLGKYLLGIHVIKEDGSRLSLLDAIVRRIPFFLEFFWIDGIVAFFTARKQRAFDLVARTLVVDCRPASAGAGAGATLPATEPGVEV